MDHRGEAPSRQSRPHRRPSLIIGKRTLDSMTAVGAAASNGGGPTATGEQPPRFVVWIIELYKRWGVFIARWPMIAILFCLALSAASTYKIVNTPQQNDITEYSPAGARAKLEREAYDRFFSSDGLPISTYLFVVAKDNGSMLRIDYLREAIDNVMDYSMNNLSMLNRESGQNESFTKFCRAFCIINEPVRQFYNGLSLLLDDVVEGRGLPESGDQRLKLTYPIAKIYGQEFSLQPNFFGLEYYKTGGHGVESVEKEGEKQLVRMLRQANASQEAADENDGSQTNFNADDSNNSNDENADNSTAATTTISPEEAEKRRASVKLSDEEWSRITNIRSVKMVALQLRAEHRPYWTKEDVKNFERRVVHYFQNDFKSERLKVYILAQTYVEDEMVRAGMSMLPYLSVGFVVMCCCSVASVFIRALYMHQQNFFKILLAIAACLTPLLACSTALAFMFVCGVRFASILCVIPFLVLSIGVDSSYLMLHEWQRVTKHSRDHFQAAAETAGTRMSQVLSEVGPAILISALTNMLADGVGAFTSSPEIAKLCLGNALSMMLTYFYMMTFYCALMALVGEQELSEDQHRLDSIRRNLGSVIIDQKKRKLQQQQESGVQKKQGISVATAMVDVERAAERELSMLHRRPSRFHEISKPVLSKYMTRYVNLVTHRVVATLTALLYIAYLAFSIWGITRMNIGLTTRKLFALDSPLIELDDLRVAYVVPHFSVATIFVQNPGDLSHPQQIRRIDDLVSAFEHVPGSWGPDGTKYFMRDYAVFKRDFTDPDYGDEETSTTGEPGNDTTQPDQASGFRFDPAELSYFLQYPSHEYWNGFINFRNGSTTDVSEFMITTGYRGKQLKVWTERGKLLTKWRAVADNFSDLSVSVFHEDGVFLDLIDNMSSDTATSVFVTMLCMAAVCFVFLNNLFTVSIAALSVLSICAGILGILSWLGIDLDPITTAAMTISVGFSVDIPAHVSYHYYQATLHLGRKSRPAERLADCLSAVAFPALQAALSTILCVSSLLFVKLYMAEVFVKTMIICVVLCNLHGLIFIPAILTTIDNFWGAVNRRRRRHLHLQKVHELDGLKPKPALDGTSPPSTELSSGGSSSSTAAQNTIAGGRPKNPRNTASAPVARVVAARAAAAANARLPAIPSAANMAPDRPTVYSSTSGESEDESGGEEKRTRKT